MSRVIVLDTGPLGLVTNPKLSSESAACAQWLQARIAAGNRIIIPEIADYEVRRELLRASKTKGFDIVAKRTGDLFFETISNENEVHRLITGFF